MMETGNMTILKQDIADGIRSLGLSGCPLCVHSSLCSMGWVEGGAKTVIDGILDEGCTLMAPTFSWVYSVSPPRGVRPARNAYDYDIKGKPQRECPIYTPESMEIDEWEMGAIPSTILRSHERTRGNHPICSFSAIGPLAKQLISSQQPNDVYAPLKTLCELGGYILLIGVSLNKMTLIHLAEQLAGREMFRRWANGPDGKPMMVEVGGCSVGFENLEPVLAPVAKRTTVGSSIWQAYPAKETLGLAVESITKHPEITHCGDPDCGRCDDAVAGGPVVHM